MASSPDNQYVAFGVKVVKETWRRFSIESYSRDALVGYSLGLLLLGYSTGFLGKFMTDLLCVLVPLYYTCHATYGDYADARSAQLKWLSYWILFGCFVVFETVMGVFINISQFYYFAKCAALLAATLPKFDGIGYLAQTYMQPYFRLYFVQPEQTVPDGEAAAKTISAVASASVETKSD